MKNYDNVVLNGIRNEGKCVCVCQREREREREDMVYLFIIMLVKGYCDDGE